MPKLAIYVPKKDMKEIEKWRKKINFSRIFMAALGREIRQRTRTVRAAKDKVATAADYYRGQLAENSEPLVDFGYQLGAEQVMSCRLSAATIGQLLTIAQVDPWTERDTQILGAALNADEEALAKFFEENSYDDHSYPTRRQAIMRGYLKGVADAWEKVCDHMNTG